MTDTRGLSFGAGLMRRSWAALHLHWRAVAALALPPPSRFRSSPRDTGESIHHLLAARGTRLGKCAMGAGIAAALVVIIIGGLWLRLSLGPLSIDMVTPLLTSAIEERFGGRHHVEVGGTQVERTEEGYTAVRMRDIVVRDRDGTVVAVAPKAEVGISAPALLIGSIRPQRLSLIGAGVAVRIEPDGQLSVMPGAEAPQTTVAPKAAASPGGFAGSPLPVAPVAGGAQSGDAKERLAALLGWLDRLDALGLDGSGLGEIGLKSGRIVVDDRRNGKQLIFDNINLSLTRPASGGIALAITSTGADGPWSLVTTVTPRGNGERMIEAIARDVSPRDLLLALRMGGGDQFDATTPISATIHAELAADASPLSLEGQIVAGAGHVGLANDADTRMLIDEAQMSVRWDRERGLLMLPLEISAGLNHFSLLSRLEPPHERNAAWSLAINGGRVELGSSDPRRGAEVVLDRIDVRGRVDPANRRVEIMRADLGGIGASGSFAGALDFSGTEPRLIFNLSANPMTVSAMRRLWPVLVQPKLRAWIGEHILAASVDRLSIGVNAPVNTLRPGGPPLPDDGLSIEIVANGTVLQPFQALPALREADLYARIVGRTATVKVGRAVGVLGPSGRKLTFTNGVFEVPDTQPEMPISHTRVRVDGTVDAAAELANFAPLRQAASVPLDPATSRGNFVAQVAMSMPLNNELPKNSVVYSIDADVTNLAVDRLVRGQKLEAATARVSANAQGVQIKGDVRIGGTPANIDYRKPVGDADAEVRLQGTLDDAARARFGDLGLMVGGAIPVKLNGRIGSGDHESRFSVDCDLIQAKITDLLPGWTKLPGKPTRATFTFVDKGRAFRVEDLVIEGSGTLVKGTLDLDADGDVVLASFPTFVVSDGDKASLRAERGTDGTLKVTMRGDVYDGRNFVKGAIAGGSSDKTKPQSPPRDLDLDIKMGALAGFNGEALRNVELRLTRRAGNVRTFMLHSKIGRDASLSGDLRAYSNGRQVVFFQTNDAGALFRLTDTYPRVSGGRMWIAMDPPTPGDTPLDGHLELTDFTVRGEPALERVAGGVGTDPNGRPTAGAGVKFDSMDVKFTRAPGKLVVHEGLVRGQAIGATLEGHIDYAHDDVRMRGTFLPAYELNTLFSQPPIIGFFLGGGRNQGLIGITYEVVGSPHAPTLRVNPMSIAAPGFLRKPFEFRGPDDNMGAQGFAGDRR